MSRSYYSSSSSDGSGAKLIVAVIMLVFLAIFYIWFYSASSNGEGVVASKWTESHTSCSTSNGHTSCSTTISYLLQFDDGKVLGVFWGNRDWDRMIQGHRIKYEARGRNIGFFGWRIMQPYIFSFKDISSE